MARRPNHSNDKDACCACGRSYPCPTDHEKPGAGELEVWHPNPQDPPQWICKPCKLRLEKDEKR